MLSWKVGADGGVGKRMRVARAGALPPVASIFRLRHIVKGLPAGAITS